MLIKMESSGGGGGYYDNQFSLITTNMSPTLNRCTIREGGYFIKNGVCFIDVTIQLSFDSSGTSTYLQVPSVSASNYIASNNGTKWQVMNDGGYQAMVNADGNARSGDTVRLIGAYITSDADTV